MIEETKTLITICEKDIANIVNQKNKIDEFNMKLRILREQQLFDSLTRASRVRINLMERVEIWMGMLEKRIFQQKTIDELHITKVISLLKFTGSIALKLMAQMNDIEKVFKAYIDSSLAVKEFEEKKLEETKNVETVNSAKTELINALLEGLKRQSDVEVIEKPNVIEESVKKLGEEFEKISESIDTEDKNFKELTEKIEKHDSEISDDDELDLS
jgi:hypothetical protein